MPASPRPTLLFLHGSSGYKKPRVWLGPLNEGLVKMGVEPFDEANVPVINYKKLLRGAREERTKRVLSEPASSTERRSFDRNREALAKRLARYNRNKRHGLDDVPRRARRTTARLVRNVGYRRTAEAYRWRRQAVTDYVREKAGSDDLIVVGHSLGSVVAADLVQVLRPDQRVRLLITLGSPLNAGKWDRTWKGLRPFPHQRLGAWVNIYNRFDFVTGGVGLRQCAREVIDVRIGDRPKFARAMRRPQGLKKLVLAQHKLRAYASNPAFAEAVAWALEGDAAAPIGDEATARD